MFYAHSTENPQKNTWQSLITHLSGVSALAKEYASSFNASGWGEAAGIFHDLGKATPQFQKRLEGGPRVDHSAAGARYLWDKSASHGALIGQAIAGHHTGLKNSADVLPRIQSFDLHPATKAFAQSLENTLPNALPFNMQTGFERSFFMRMLYSCLVDADFCDTERFLDTKKSALRGHSSSLNDLHAAFISYMEKLTQKAPTTSINTLRQSIYSYALKQAEQKPGLFTLTVPTGGGKTLTSLGFALKHAQQHGMRRIIYVIPYTSIIEQNAAVFEKALGTKVLEHHSNFNFKELKNSYAPQEMDRALLATENWDAPVIVTTSVQFYESLFANKSSQCRKLHNIAESVIILDEAQMIPTPYLFPCLEAINELCTHYSCSAVLCTATQPALRTQDGLKAGLNLPTEREIAPNPQELQTKFKRVEAQQLGEINENTLLKKIRAEKQSLCIVNTRKTAQRLFEGLKKTEGIFHLSTLMYPLHRKDVLSEIRIRLSEDKPCTVISTQLIEAGVDVDFPRVFREEAGLDSIAQAAGRCNREGRRKKGLVSIFQLEGSYNAHFAAQCSAAREALRSCPQDILGLDAIKKYFQKLFWELGKEQLDSKQIIPRLEEGAKSLRFDFEDIARDFRIIETQTQAVVITKDEEPRRIVEKLRFAPPSREDLRELQQYTVQIWPHELRKLQAAGVVEQDSHELFHILLNNDLYSPYTGLSCDDPTHISTETLTNF